MTFKVVYGSPADLVQEVVKWNAKHQNLKYLSLKLASDSIAK